MNNVKYAPYAGMIQIRFKGRGSIRLSARQFGLPIFYQHQYTPIGCGLSRGEMCVLVLAGCPLWEVVSALGIRQMPRAHIFIKSV